MSIGIEPSPVHRVAPAVVIRASPSGVEARYPHQIEEARKDMLLKITSTGPLENIERRLQDSAARHQFGIIATHDLQDAMKKKGVELQMECRIYEVCNPLQAKKVLESDGAISTALPCWISVYGSPAHYTLATMRPTELMKAFGNPEIEPVAREVEEVLLEMMNEAAGNKG